jgi:hypothetical protein
MYGLMNNTEVSRLAMEIAQMAINAPNPGAVLEKYKLMPNYRLAAFLADGMVRANESAAENQQALQNYNPNEQPVLDKLQMGQQGVAAIPTTGQMFDPTLHSQGGIGAGIADDQGQEQPVMHAAGGGIVAFAPGGSTGGGNSFPFNMTPAEFDALSKAEQIEKLRIAKDLRTPQQPIGPETPEARLAREARISGAQERVAASRAATAATTPPTPGPANLTPAQLNVARDLAEINDRIKTTIIKKGDPSKLIAVREELLRRLPVVGSGAASPIPPAAPPAGIPAAAAQAGIPPAGAVPPGAVPPGAVPPGAPPTQPNILQRGLGAIKGKMPSLAQAGRLAGRVAGVGGVGLTAYQLADAGIDALDTEGNFRRSVSEGPLFQSAEAEEAARGATGVVPQADIDAYRKQRQEAVSVLPIPETLQVIRQRESGNRNLVNPLSGASGPGQMVKGTFELLKKKYPELKDYSWNDYKKESKVQDVADIALLKDQEVTLKNLGHIPNAVNHAVMWFGGPKLLTAKEDAPIESVFSKKEVEQNPNVKGKTVGQVRSMIAVGMSGQKMPSEKGTAGRAVDTVLQTPRNAAVALGADPNAAEAIPATRSEWGQRIWDSFGPSQLAETGRVGLNAARMGTANALEAMFGAGPATPAKPAEPAKATAQEQYMQSQAQDALSKARQMTSDKQDQRDIAVALMQAGFSMLGSTSPYAGVGFGQGATKGLETLVGLQQKREERAAKAEEKEKDRAEKRYERAIALELGQIKTDLPGMDVEGNRRALAMARVITSLGREDRIRNGITDAEYKRALATINTFDAASQGKQGKTPPSSIQNILNKYAPQSS